MNNEMPKHSSRYKPTASPNKTPNKYALPLMIYKKNIPLKKIYPEDYQAYKNVKCIPERQIMTRLKILLGYIFMTSQLFGQDYIEYHRTFNRIDEDVLSQNFSVAIERLDSIYSKYNFIYAKHCVKALQISIAANDSMKADKWLEKCFKQGIPVWIIRTNEITNKSLTYSTTHKTLNNFDSLYSIYKASIDTTLSKKIDSLLTIDQKYTQKVNNGFVLFIPIYWMQWAVNNNRQLKQLKQIIEKYGYPEERKIGLFFIQDSVSFAKHFKFWGPSELRDSRFQIMLQHCYSTRNIIDYDLKDNLYKNLCNGNLPAFQYALIIDFMVPDKLKYMNYKYLISSKEYNLNDIEIINKNRKLIGRPTIEQEKRNLLIETERRKNRKANSEIMLEY